MFRVPLRFLSSLFLFFNIISTLQDQNQVVVFSSSYLLQTPSSHWWVSHQSNNQSNVSERKQWEPFTLLHFTAAPLLQWSTQLSAPTPPLWSTLLFSQWWLTHTECFFFFSCQIFHFYSRCWNTFTTGRKETVQPLQAVPGWWALKALTCLQNVPWRMWIILLFCAVFFSLISPSHSLSLTRLYQDRL